MSFISDAETILTALEAYYQASVARQGPVLAQKPAAEIVANLELEKLVKSGGLAGENLAAFIRQYLETTNHLHHPAYMGHQVAVPHYAGSLAAMIDGFTNNAMAIYEMGPGASSIEFFVLNWLLEKVGWRPSPIPPDFPEEGQIYGGGVLTHGGSLGNLTALIAARSRVAPEVWEQGNPGDLALLTSPMNHYSIARAAGILGIGQKAIYHLEVDSRGVILPDRLEQVYQRVLADGKRAVALVANACCTAVGLYDPLREIGEFCRQHNLWLHVDGAHGASALLSERLRHYLDGVELADSLVWDAHKMLRAPTLCAAVLVRDGRTLDGAFQQEASYLFHEKDQPGFDFLHRTVECTKAGLGLRLFMVLGALGEQGLASYVERQYDLAAQAYEYIRQQPGFECPVSPQANILCFRIHGDDERQMAIRQRLTAAGDFYISTSMFMDKRYLRLSLMNPETALEDVQHLVEHIRTIAIGNE
jgi:L-2,4-diaminobutyrate decarboxylase